MSCPNCRSENPAGARFRMEIAEGFRDPELRAQFLEHAMEKLGVAA